MNIVVAMQRCEIGPGAAVPAEVALAGFGEVVVAVRAHPRGAVLKMRGIEREQCFMRQATTTSRVRSRAPANQDTIL